MKEIKVADSGSSHVDLEQGRPQGVQAPSENDREETGEGSSQVNPELEARGLEEIEMADSGEGSSHVDLEQERPQGSQAQLENEINELRLELGSGRVSGATLKKKIKAHMPAATASNSISPSIWRVHPLLRDVDAKAYEPRMVSVGPLHQGMSELLPMEEFKLEILCQLLNGQQDDTLDIFLGEVSVCLPKVRDDYAEKIELSDDEFAAMLVIDGCFVVVYCIFYGFLPDLENTPSYWSMFFHQGEIGIRAMKRDLLLLENQIPFFVVNKLYQKIVDMFPGLKSKFPDLTSLFLHRFNISLAREKYPEEEKIRHLLHLIHLSQDPKLVSDVPVQQSCWQQATTLMRKVMGIIFAPFLGLVYLILFRDWSALFGGSKQRRFSGLYITLPSATELHEAGVTFKKKATPQEYYGPYRLKVSFRDGTLEIPGFCVDDSTCSTLRNLIAFEQREFFFFPPHFTHYCVLLDGLINTAEDVSILRRSGILENMMGSDSEVAEMFNGLCKEVFQDKYRNYYTKLYKDVMEFVEVPHHKWRANLVHTYFRNPWTIFSFMAALVLVVFTVTQTMFTIYPRKQP